MAEVGALRITIGLNSAGVSQGIQDLNLRLRALNSEYRAVSTGSAKLDNSLETLRHRHDVLTRTMQTHRTKVEELRRKYEQSKATKGEDAAETVRLAAAYNRAVAAMRTTEQHLNNVNREIENQTSEFRQLERSVNTSVDGITRQLRVLETGFDAAAAGSDHLENSIEQLRNRSQHLSQTLNLQQERVRELTRLHQASAQATGADSAATQEIQIRLNRATQQMRETENQLRQTTNQIQHQSNAWNRLRQRVGDAGEHMQRVGGRMQSIGSEISQSFGAAFIAVSAGLGLTAKKAMDFESQMSSVKSVMSPEEVKEFGKSLEELSLKMGADTKFSALEAAQGVEELIKAGVQVTDIINGGLDGALSLAVAGELELADAAEVASTALNAFKKDSLSVMEAADLLAGAANASATDVGELKFGLSMVSAVASGVGLSFRDTTTALAAFAQNGLRGSDAGTSLKTMLLRLSPTTKEAATTFEQLGLSAYNTSAAYKYLIDKGITPTGRSLTELEAGLKKLTEQEMGAKASKTELKKGYEENLKASGLMSSAFYNEKGELKSMAEIADLLKTKLAGLNNEQRQNALRTMFGTDAIRAANILYKEGAAGITEMADAMDKVKSADVAATKLDNVKGRITILKGVVETAAISFGHSLLPTIDKVVASVQKATNWFNSLSDSTKETIAKAALVTAGLTGVVTAVGLGLSVVGAAVSGFGALASAFSAAAGVATLLSGPVGWVAAGLGALALAAIGVTKAVTKKNEALEEAKAISFETIEAQQKEIKSNEELIRNFEQLRSKNKLSNDEMLRFLDIQEELSATASPEKIADLKREQEQLLKKSGLTNKEMENFLEYNDLIIEKSPDTEKAISSQGKAFAKNADELKKVNAEKLASMKIDAELAITQNLEKENSLLKDKSKAVADIKEKEAERVTTYQNISKLTGEIAEKEKEITSLKAQQDENLKSNDIDAINRGKAKLDQAEREKQSLQAQLDTEKNKREVLLKQIDDKQQILEKSNAELKKIDESKYKYEQIILATVGLNSERGKGLATLQLEIAKLERQKSQLGEMRATGKLNTAEYNEQVGAIDRQIGKLQSAHSELKNVNETAGKTVYKDIVINGDAKEYARELNELLGRTVSKQVIVHQTGWNPAKAYAKGTRYAPGGTSLVGEAGRELTYLPSGGFALISEPTLLNLPQGARVIPNYDTEKILRSWNVPRLAGGGVTIKEGWAVAGERGREIVDLRGAQTGPISSGQASTSQDRKMDIIIEYLARLLTKDNSVYLDGKEIYNSNQKHQNNHTNLRNIFKGVTSI